MKPVQEEHHLELYIALETDREEQKILQCLTTDVMQWAEDIWIMDLTRFHSYWLKQADRARLNLLGLWRKLFNHLLGEEPDDSGSKVISLSPSYRACCARTPWSSVLLLHAMREREINGIISLNSTFGQSLFREISWTAWWRQIEIIEGHLLRSKTKGYRQAGFRQQCKRLQLAVPRLDFKRPWDMHILNRPGVKKRFGETLAIIWDWTYGNAGSPPQTIYQSQFPWKPWYPLAVSRVERNLDYPLLFWDQFAPLLVEDLDKLCQATRNSGERIMQMNWRLTFETMCQLTVPILFRNPHNLQEEKAHHVTSLLQANYGFTNAINQAFPPDAGGTHCETIPLVLGWELKITSSLYLPDVVMDIFGEDREKGGELDTLLRLQNELPVTLSRFLIREDWYPEDSFDEEHFTTEEIMPSSAEIKRSLEALAEERPLFIRKAPLALDTFIKISSATFLESSMTKWWQDGTSGARERNYFKHIDLQGNALWVFQNAAGQWYHHGIFG